MKLHSLPIKIGLGGTLGAGLIIGGAIASGAFETPAPTIEPQTEPSAEVAEPTPEVAPVETVNAEPVVVIPEPEPEDECSSITNHILRKYGSLDYFEALGSLHDGLTREQLAKHGFTSWEQVKEHFARNHGRIVDTALHYGDVKTLMDLEAVRKVRCNL